MKINKFCYEKSTGQEGFLVISHIVVFLLQIINGLAITGINAVYIRKLVQL